MGCVAHVGCGQMEALEAKLADMHDLIKTAALGSPPALCLPFQRDRRVPVALQ